MTEGQIGRQFRQADSKDTDIHTDTERHAQSQRLTDTERQIQKDRHRKTDRRQRREADRKQTVVSKDRRPRDKCSDWTIETT